MMHRLKENSQNTKLFYFIILELIEYSDFEVLPKNTFIIQIYCSNVKRTRIKIVNMKIVRISMYLEQKRQYSCAISLIIGNVNKCNTMQFDASTVNESWVMTSCLFLAV